VAVDASRTADVSVGASVGTEAEPDVGVGVDVDTSAGTHTRAGMSARARVRALTVPVGRALVRFRMLPWLLAAALVVVTAAVAFLGYRVHQENLNSSRDQDVLAAARQEALNFISIDYQNFDQDTQNVLSGATGDFKQQFSDESSTLKTLVNQNKAISSGQVLQAGVVSSSASAARVLIVADATVANTAAPSGQVRNYRLQMDLVDQNGQWLTSDIQFVG
jgi:Mce-associated membrane protein